MVANSDVPTEEKNSLYDGLIVLASARLKRKS